MEKRHKKLSKILRARELRKGQTKAEQILWHYLRDRKFFGKKFRRQHIIRGFIIDFYCSADNLAVELDGSIHFKQKEYDSERDNALKDSGIKLLHFRNNQILNNLKPVLQTIKKNLTLLHVNGEGRQPKTIRLREELG